MVNERLKSVAACGKVWHKEEYTEKTSRPMWIANASQEIGIALAALAMLGYGAVTLACMAFTAAEGQAEGRGWNAWRTAGLALCVVWPVMILVFAAAQIAQRRLNSA